MKVPTESRAASRSTTFIAVLVVGVLLFLPFGAFADGWISGYFGRAFGGETGADLGQALRNRDLWTYGFNAGAMGGGVFGAEFDFAYTPKFFGTSSLIKNSGVMTIMGSLIAGIPVGGQYGAGIRPYGVFGVGLIRRRLEFTEIFDDISSNDFGWNAGGGIMGFFNRTLGVRGEYRYFRNFSSENGNTFNFSRASLGIVLRF